MKAIINGKRYNTETATEVASDGYGLPNDFRSWEEVLYLTPRGNWFLWGKGGPMTKYRQDTGNGWTGGSRIIPLSPEEAKEWLENHRYYKELEEYFSSEIEDA